MISKQMIRSFPSILGYSRRSAKVQNMLTPCNGIQMHPLTEAFQASLAAADLPSDPVGMAYICSIRPLILESFNPRNGNLKADSHNYAAQPGILKSTANHVGLNTIGMLVDRLSILVVKLHFSKSDGQIEATNVQIRDIESAIAASCPGSSSAFNKVTTIQAVGLPEDFSGSAMRLAGTNLLLWMAQDVLYLRGPNELPDQELRDYITFFAEQNVLRNRLISLSDYHFWN
jgi:hypothetical protein